MNLTFKIRPCILLVLGLLFFFTTATQAQDEKIWGGTATDICTVPWQVSVEFGGNHGCGGSIISPEWIISAAHCYQFTSASNLIIHAGSTFQLDNSVGQRIQVDQIILHPDFKSGPEHNDNDIALLHLSEPLCFNDCVQPITMADANTVLTAGMVAIISGWGDTEAPGGCCTDELISASLPVITDATANTLMNDPGNGCGPNNTNAVGATTVAFFQEGVAAGPGDSGGPAVVDINGVPTLVGASSWGGCPRGDFPTMYAEIAALSSWVGDNATPMTTPVECDASFTVSFEEDDAGNLFFNLNNADDPSFEHSWTVVGHPASGTGPYTTVAQGDDAEFDFQGELGGCYTIMHQVTTPCGTCCYSREICNKNYSGEWTEQKAEVDCDDLCNLITPTGLGCGKDLTGYLVLSWDEVIGATGYIVEMTFRDPDCCDDGGTPTTSTFEVDDDFLRLDFYPICMSWTVTAICPSGLGPTSEKMCFDYENGCNNCRLETPVNLNCSVDQTGYLVLSWDEIAGATGYTLTMTFRDPDCCNEGGTPSTKSFDIDENFIRLDFYPICMSWTVTAHCPNGEGQTSDKVCFDYQIACKGKGKSKNDVSGKVISHTELREGDYIEIQERSSLLSIYPNPSSGVINFSIELNENDRVNQIAILDLSGKVVELIDYAPTNERAIRGTYTIENDLSGLYMIQVQLNSSVITERIMIVKY